MYHDSILKGYKVTNEGTEIKILIPSLDLTEDITRHTVKKCGVWLDDNRRITSTQRKKIYACINDISEWTGYTEEMAKERLKLEHMLRSGCKSFSLSDCSITTAREFINTIIDYCLENGVHLNKTAMEYSDDLEHYFWKCLKEKVCCVCGRPHADLHHLQAIGRGFDRTHFDDSELLKVSLCREHHTESHKIGQPAFCKKYKVKGVKFNEG